MKCCRTCGAELVRKRYANGDLEPNATFRQRLTCGRACKLELWKKPEELVMAVAFPYFPAALIGKALGKDPGAVNRKGASMGMRRTARGRTNASSWAYRHRRAQA